MPYDEKTAERVRKALSGQRGVVEKKLMGGLSFMVKAGMVCSVSGRGGLLVRVAPDDYERMLQQPHAQPVAMGARTMGGFVRVLPDGYRSEKALSTWLKRGLDGVAARPASAPKRRRSAKAKAAK